MCAGCGGAHTWRLSTEPVRSASLCSSCIECGVRIVDDLDKIPPSLEDARGICPECERFLANSFDEGIHNTGACGCAASRALCWRNWNPGGKCLQSSVYDPTSVYQDLDEVT